MAVRIFISAPFCCKRLAVSKRRFCAAPTSGGEILGEDNYFHAAAKILEKIVELFLCIHII